MLLWLLIGTSCIFAVASDTPSSAEAPDVYFPSIEWSDTFDWKLLKALSQSETKNTLVSPIGLKLLLALLYEGSNSLTENEFRRVLQFSPNKTELRESYKKILESLQPSERKEYILNLGTRIFLDYPIKPKQNYKSISREFYRAEIEPTNFSDPISASQSVNSWIEKLTNGKVPTLLSPDSLQDAIMILANAIYFKGTWRHQFPKNQTADGGFYVSPSQVVNVPFMTTTGDFFFHESTDLDAKILRLPYKGGSYSLFVLLPNSKEGHVNLVNNINLQSLSKQLYMMSKTSVEVRLPKFKFNYQAKFNKILRDFGLTQMFQNTASFPGIGSGGSDLLRKLVVTDVVQKTGIELDEEGSEVYAATEIQVGNKFGEIENVFNATHPFLFFLEEQTSGTILFIGKVYNPLDTSNLDLPPRLGQGLPAQPQPLDVPNLQPENPEKTAVLTRFNYFDLELLKELSESTENVFVSPASVKTVLSLILEGSKGKSAQQLGSALRITDINEKEIREALMRLLFDLNDRGPNTVLESASAIFASNQYKIVPEYKNKVTKDYRASFEQLDFSKPNEAAQYVNSWASNATHGLVKQIISPDNFYDQTAMILTNALYFKGKWKHGFNPKSTKDKHFASPSRGNILVPMMQVSDTFNYNFDHTLNSHVVEIPYLDDKYAMLLLLPNDGNSIKTVAKDMQHSQLNQIVNELKPTELILEIPRFEIEYKDDLVNILKALKIVDIFGLNANLSGIVLQNNVRISNVVHKTRIEVNEQGTRAAATTAAAVIPLMGSSSPRIIANHPFIFFIYHKESLNIIFEGLYIEPTSPIKETLPYSSVASRSSSNQYFRPSFYNNYYN